MSKQLAEMVHIYLTCIQNIAMGSSHIIGVRLQYENHILKTTKSQMLEPKDSH